MENFNAESEQQKVLARAIKAARVREDYYNKREQKLQRAKENHIKNRKVFHCECGGTVTSSNRGAHNSLLAIHLKTKKHIYYIQDNIEI